MSFDKDKDDQAVIIMRWSYDIKNYSLGLFSDKELEVW